MKKFLFPSMFLFLFVLGFNPCYSLDLFSELTSAVNKKVQKPEKTWPEAEMEDKELEQSMIKAVSKTDGIEGTPVAARIIDEEWNVEVNDFGVIKKRSIMGAVAIKRKDGTAYYVTALFAQKYNGDGYGKTYILAGWGSNECGVYQELDPNVLK